jgi:hypothetical protein
VDATPRLRGKVGDDGELAYSGSHSRDRIDRDKCSGHLAESRTGRSLGLAEWVYEPDNGLICFYDTGKVGHFGLCIEVVDAGTLLAGQGCEDRTGTVGTISGTMNVEQPKGAGGSRPKLSISSAIHSMPGWRNWQTHRT